MLSKKGTLLLAVALLDSQAEVVFANLDDVHLPASVVLRVARVRSIYHHGLAKLASN